MEQAFQDFLMSVPAEEQAFVVDLDALLKEHQYEYSIQTAKNGYMVSYFKKVAKKKMTLINFVFRKTGVKIRIYAGNVAKYQSFLDTLPEKMKAEIVKAGDCKRLFDPTACNSRCQMGFAFVMDGAEYKKCRNMAFMPTLCEENDKYIKDFLCYELKEVDEYCNSLKDN